MTEDKGDVRIDGDTVSIPLFARAVDGKPRRVVGRTLVDLADYQSVIKDLSVRLMHALGRRKQYANCWVDGKSIPLSHAVAGNPPRGQVKDHINGDSMDNRRVNLRDVTRRLNSQNKAKAKGTTSQYIGVSWKKPRGKWTAQASSTGSRVYLGLYTSEAEAAKAYDTYILHQYGLEGKTNGILSEEEIEAALADDTVKQPVNRKKSGLPKGVYVKGKRFRAYFTDEHGVQHSASHDTIEKAKAWYDAETERVAQVLEVKHLAQSITRNAEGNAIIMTNQSRGVKREVLVSESQWYELARHGWNWTGPYPQGTVNGNTMLMHRYVWQLANPDKAIPDGHVVDHTLQDKGDCRVESLHLTTLSANSQNKRKLPGTSSQYTGVRPTGLKWKASIYVNRKLMNLGTFDAEVDAARAYNAAVDKYYSGGMKNVLPPVSKRVRVK